MVLIDRGFVPDALKAPSSRALGQVEQIVEVTGLVACQKSRACSSPTTRPAPIAGSGAISRHVGLDVPLGAVEVAPFFVEAEKSAVPGGWPEGGQTRLVIVNNHLQYALTWFALAACLLAVYAAYVWSHYRHDRP